MVKSIILIGLTIFILLGCTKAEIPEANTVSACCNQHATVFLHNAVMDKSSQVLENTTYDIYINGKYIGQYKGDNNNLSFINVSAYDRFLYLAKAGPDVNSDTNEFTVPCAPNYHLVPTLILSSKDLFKISYYSFPIEGGIKTPSFENVFTIRDYVPIEYRTRDFAIGCSYDYRNLKMQSNEAMITTHFNRNSIFDFYSLRRSASATEIMFKFYPDVINLNTTIDCTIFDYDFYAREDGPIYDILDERGNDVGQPNFNFQINISKVE